MCPSVPLWFIALASFGAMCAVALPIYALVIFAGKFAGRHEEERITYINQRKEAK